MLNNKIIVNELSGKEIIVFNVSNNYEDFLNKIGFKKNEENYSIFVDVNDLNKRSTIIQKLNEADTLFMYGRGWSPSEIIEYYRDDLRIIKGSYKIVSWKDKDNYIIREI